MKPANRETNKRSQPADEAAVDAAFGGGEDGDAALNLAAAAKKKRQAPRVLKEGDVVGQNGVWLLYERLVDAKLGAGQGKELSDLHRYTGLISQWAKDMFPRGHKDDTVERIGEWGGKSMVKSTLSRLRGVEVRRSLLGEMPKTKELRAQAAAVLAQAEEAAKQRKDKRKRGMNVEDIDVGSDDEDGDRDRKRDNHATDDHDDDGRLSEPDAPEEDEDFRLPATVRKGPMAPATAPAANPAAMDEDLPYEHEHAEDEDNVEAEKAAREAEEEAAAEQDTSTVRQAPVSRRVHVLPGSEDEDGVL